MLQRAALSLEHGDPVARTAVSLSNGRLRDTAASSCRVTDRPDVHSGKRFGLVRIHALTYTLGVAMGGQNANSAFGAWVVAWVSPDAAARRLALSDALAHTRPWTSRGATRNALADWWQEYVPAADQGSWEVAELLQELGKATDLPSDPTMMVALMLENVAHGRAPGDYGFMSTPAPAESGISDRQLRRYRAAGRLSERLRDDATTGLDFDPIAPLRGTTGLYFDPIAPLRLLFRRLQRRADIAELVAGGRTPQTARAWLRNNPGSHATDAPPPRKPRA